MKVTIMIKGNKFLSAVKLIREWDIHYITLHRLIEDGTLPAPIRLGRRLYFGKADLAERLVIM